MAPRRLDDMGTQPRGPARRQVSVVLPRLLGDPSRRALAPQLSRPEGDTLTTTYMRRSDWTTHPPVRPLAAMPATPSGFAVHWPGMTKGSAPTTQAGVASRLESYRVLHTSPGGIGTKDGGNDIAYQWCADLMGRLWPLRGFTH